MTFGCAGCREVGVAELGVARGVVERDRSASPHAWTKAATGAVFQAGDAVRTGKDGSAQVRLTQGTVLQLGPNSLVRFLDQPPATASKNLTGKELTAGSGAVAVESGSAPLQTGSVVRLGDQKDVVGVVVGRATVLAKTDGVVALGGGGRFAVDLGKPDVVGGSEGLTAAPVITNVARVDFTIPAGEAATIHDPEPPTRVGIDFSSRCPRAVVELQDFALTRVESTAEGDGSANFAIPKGGHRYYVYCLEGGKRPAQPSIRGSIIVQKDAGQTVFGTKAPGNTIDADGRRYTLVYQNLKPVLTIRWPNAPRAPEYLLHLTPDGRQTKSYRTRAPEQVFRSGAIVEGNYRYQFQAGKARSPLSAVKLTFDRNARIGFVQEPADGQAKPGSTVRVQGGAISGATVRINGAQVPVDKLFRFETDAVVPVNQDAFVVRIGHRGAGVHYYLRRLAGVKR